MSIAHASEISETSLAVWLIWLAVAIALGLYAGRDRWWELATIRREDQLISLRLLVSAGVTFLVFLGMQLVVIGFLRRTPGAIVDGQLTGPAIAAMSVLCPGAAAIVALVLVRHRPVREAVGLWSHRLPVSVLWGLLGAVVAIPIVFVCLHATLLVLNELRIEHPDQHRLLEVFSSASQPWVKYAVIAAALVIAPVFEELLYRGLIQTSLTRLTGRAWVGIVIASLVFAGVHEGWTQPPIFVLSLVIGIVYAFSANLWSAILLHALFNAFSLIVSGGR